MKILFVPRSRDATAFYRCTVPAKYLLKAGHEVRTNFYNEGNGKRGLKREDVEWAETIIFQRPVTVNEAKIVQSIKSQLPDKLLFGDYDDDYENVPNWNPGYTYLNAHKDEWKESLKFFDGVTVSTQALADLVSLYTSKKVSIVPNGMDIEEILSAPLIDEHKLEYPIEQDGKIQAYQTIKMTEFNEKVKDKIVIGWFGSRSHYCDIDWLPEQLAEVMYANEDIYCVFVGYSNWRFVTNLPDGRFWVAPGIAPVTNYYRLLRSLKLDIALAPVDPIPFNESKSSIKVFEAMLSNIFPIASNFDTYEENIHRGALAGYRYGDWTNTINSVVNLKKNDPEEFNEILRDNKQWVVDNHHAKLRTELYLKAWGDALLLKYSEGF